MRWRFRAIVQRRLVFLTTGVLIALIGGGCHSYNSPSVSVTGAGRGMESAAATVIHIALEMRNPNDTELRMTDFEYDVAINGVRVFAGRRSAEATLARGDSREISLPAVVPHAAVGWAADGAPAEASYSIRGSVQYIAPGELARIFRDMGFPNPSASFAGSGQVDLRPAAATASR